MEMDLKEALKMVLDFAEEVSPDDTKYSEEEYDAAIEAVRIHYEAM